MYCLVALQIYIFSKRYEMRLYAAEMYAISVAYGEDKRHGETIQDMISNLTNKVNPDI